MSDPHGSTARVRDIFPGPRSSEIRGLTGAGQRVYFVADDGTHGREPWLTDGDGVGTRRLADLAPGPLPSSPVGFTLSGPWLYFAATDADTGFELYSVPREAVDGGLDFYTEAPCRLVDTRQGPGPLSGGYQGVTFDAAGLCGIPETAQALAVNVTALDASTPGDLVLYRAGTSFPGTSTISFTPGKARANNAIVRLGGGAFSVLALPEFDLSVHMIVDVTGYYQ